MDEHNRNDNLTHKIAISLGFYGVFIYEYRYCVFVLIKKRIKTTEVFKVAMLCFMG